MRVESTRTSEIVTFVSLHINHRIEFSIVKDTKGAKFQAVHNIFGFRSQVRHN